MELTPREQQVREALAVREREHDAARFAHVSQRHAESKCKLIGHYWSTTTRPHGHAYAECVRCGATRDI